MQHLDIQDSTPLEWEWDSTSLGVSSNTLPCHMQASGQPSKQAPRAQLHPHSRPVN